MRKIEEFPKMSEIFSATAQGYFNMVLSQRSAGGENRAGSFFDEKPEKIRENLELAKWDVESFDEECGKAIFVSKDLEGTLGMINSSNVNKNSYVIPVDTKSYGKDDRGACSFLLLNNNEYKMKKTTETRVIVSFMNQETKQVDLKTPFCLTFFPGPDIDPTKSLMFFNKAEGKTIESQGIIQGKPITVEEAKKHGIVEFKFVDKQGLVNHYKALGMKVPEVLKHPDKLNTTKNINKLTEEIIKRTPNKQR